MDDANPPAQPKTLLLHDGELEDLRRLLGELGTPFVERRGGLTPQDVSGGFDLTLATPQRLLDLEFAPGAKRSTLIAICDSDSRSLRNSLSRAGTRLMVCRPVHPAALRALVLHALYRGPEKRRSPRVSIGAPIRIKAGWRQRPAILADLSQGGCRLLTRELLEPGRSITLCIPAELAGGPAFSIKARVLRHFGQSGGEQSFSAKFESLRSRKLEQLKCAIQAHVKGPATWNGDASPAPEQNTAAATQPANTKPAAAATQPANTKPAAAATQPANTKLAAAATQPANTKLAAAATRPAAATPATARPSPAPSPVALAKPAGGDGERRAAQRRAIDRRVIALGDEAARVLMGRDISLGGMRVDPSPLLVVGESVRLALHVGNQDLPLVVTARVHRDDGERGVVLRFHELAPDSTRFLNQLLDALPVVDPGGPRSNGMIVSEILAEAQ